MNHRPTSKDVAREAGVAVSTVSLTYLAPERVSAATRDRVLEAATKLGYEKNIPASILRTRDSGPNALTRKLSLAFLHAQHWKLPTAKINYLDEVRRRAMELGYGIEAVDLLTVARKSSLGRELFSRGVSGVILGPITESAQLEGLDLAAFSLVRCGQYPFELPCHIVRPAVMRTITDAWQELLRRGYRRIGPAFFRHSPEVPDDFTREMTIIGCQERFHSKRERVPVLWNAKDASTQSVGPWFEKHRPEVILHFASPAADWAYSSGLAIPQDLGVIGLVDPWHKGECAVVENVQEIARVAVDVCDQLIRHRQTGLPTHVRETVVHGVWREGTSLRPRACNK